jgi:rhamnosyltransferase
MADFSIIIPTRNAARSLGQLLFALLKQTVICEDLILIDSSSADNTVEIGKNFTEQVVVIPLAEFDHGGTRAMAAKLAKGEILIFLTQDAIPADDFAIQNILKVFEDPKVGAAYGRQISYPETNLFGKHLREFNYPDKFSRKSRSDIPKFGIKTGFLSNSFAAYRKSALLEIGNFKAKLILGEDSVAGASLILAGYDLVYVHESIVMHSHNYSVWQEFKRYFDIGVFHKTEEVLLKKFGKVEGEGFRYLKSELQYIFHNKAISYLPEFFLRNGLKYLGYRLGKAYRILPLKLLKHFSLHSRWWERKN